MNQNKEMTAGNDSTFLVKIPFELEIFRSNLNDLTFQTDKELIRDRRNKTADIFYE